ncbi:MAG TPA: hypothetical protein VI793_20775 [Anaerolineales bacterium]|nr:hypothetical protein [Anaerolineales bacterium]
MSTTITVEGKLLGQKRPLFTDWAVTLPADSGRDHLRLRDLIVHVVLEEVRAFQQRQEERRLARILTKGEIEQAIVQGKVDMGERDSKQKVDPQAAVETALQAFEDGLYYVFVDGEQVQSLDHEVTVRADTRVTFIRLVALAGG